MPKKVYDTFVTIRKSCLDIDVDIICEIGVLSIRIFQIIILLLHLFQYTFATSSLFTHLEDIRN